MSTIWFTSDWHFGHYKDFIWKARGFSNIDEHDEALIENYNALVKPQDTVYFLGDIARKDNDNGVTCVNRLNGRILWVYGNHDTPSRIELFLKSCPNLESLGYAHMLLIGKQRVFLSHYPSITTNHDDYKKEFPMMAFFGHTHQTTNFYTDSPLIYHVGVDSHGCRPVSLDEIMADIQRRKLG